MTASNEGHCRRVAALACEMARQLRVPLDPVRARSYSQAYPRTISDDCLDRLITDLRNPNLAVSPRVEIPPVDPVVTSIVEVAHAFEHGVASLPYETAAGTDVLDEIDALRFDPAAVEALRSIAIPKVSAPSELAAYPAVLFKALALLRDEDCPFADIERIARSDQVLAASLLRVANAPLYAPVAPIRTIGRAIAQVGMDAAKRVLVSAAARPLFASARLHGIWKHAIDVATIAERLARTTGKADPAEAFVAGLVHDMGRLAIEFLPHDAVEAYHRIADDAACPVLADMAVLRCDHGEFGARVVERWSLPADLAAAIRFHHRPELSRETMPKLLYLAEFVSESDEDIPSVARLRDAMSAVGVANVSELLERSTPAGVIASVLALAG